MPRRPPPRLTPLVLDDIDHVSASEQDDIEVDENTPINDENAFSLPANPSSPLFALRSPHSHSRSSQDAALRDITDQFFHPPSPSPVRIAKRKQPETHSIEPPRRPKKPKSLAYPADPPNWLYSRSSSSLPPSSPFPPSATNGDHARLTDHSAGHAATARYEYHLGTPPKASDSDPFGFIAVERAVKAKRVVPALAPRKSPMRISATKSPPRSAVLASVPAPAAASTPALPSFFQLDPPVATNNEDIEGLYADEPVAGPSPVHVPVAPLLMMNSDQLSVDIGAALTQPTFPDPLRTPRKYKRRASPTLDGDPDPDDGDSDLPSSPSPVKISVGVRAQTHRRRSAAARTGHTPVLRPTRKQAKAAGTATPPTAHAPRTRIRRVPASRQNIPTPSSTRRSPSSRPSTAPSTPVPPRRSKRQAVVGARAKLSSATSDGEEEKEGRPARMTLRSRIAKANPETKTNSRTKRQPSKTKAKVTTRAQKAAAVTVERPTRGRPKASAKNTKGKGKARPLENVLDLSDDTLERYEKERRERLAYFKRLEGYQIQKENVYVV